MYVSHGRSDVPLVATLVEDLQSLGHDVWLDRGLPGGDRWWDRVARNVERCDLFIVALSSTTMDSQISAAELALAGAYGKPILPVLVEDGVSDAFLPPTIAEVQRVDYRSADRTAMANVVRALRATEVSETAPVVDVGAYKPTSYGHDIESQLASGDYLPPQLQMELIDQLNATAAGGLQVTKVLTLLQQFSDREDTTAKVAVKIEALRKALREPSSASNAIYRLDLRDLPDRATDDRSIRTGSRTVFLSYSRLDHEIVSELAADIEGVGWDLWLDQKLPGGRKWWDEVLRRIRDSDVVVFAASRASVSSRACHSELAYAVAVGKPLIGVVVGSEPAAALLTPQFADAPVLRYDDPSKKSFGDLYRALADTPPRHPLPDPLPVSPEVPATYMFDIRSQIQSGEVLTPSDQEQLLDQLRAYAKEGYPRHEVVELANDLHDRDDVTRRMSDELEAFAAEMTGKPVGAAEPPAPADQASGVAGAEVTQEAVAAETGGVEAAPEPLPAEPPAPPEKPAAPEPEPHSWRAEAADVPKPPVDAEPARTEVREAAPRPATPPRDGAAAVPPKRRRGLLVAVLITVLVAGGIAIAAIVNSGNDGAADPADIAVATTAPAPEPEPSRAPEPEPVDVPTTALAQPVPEWDLGGLVPSAAGLALADYTVEPSTTSTNCEDYDSAGLVEERAVQLVPRENRNHYLWAWVARFDSLEGVDSYLASWGNGCSLRPPDATWVNRLVPPMWLTDDVLWYVTLVELDDGRTFVGSVGALKFTSRWVGEAQLVLSEADGVLEAIEIDTTSPYDNARARQLVDELVDPVTAILSGL